MDILLVSDSHGNDALLRQLYLMYPNMDYYLHAGDSVSHPSMILPFESVRGNCDYYDFDEKRLIYTPFGYLLMSHYPGLIEDGIKIFVHGHTHRYKITYVKGVLTVCPGSLSRPRDDSNGSYAILTITEDNVEVTIYDLETKNILAAYKIR